MSELNRLGSNSTTDPSKIRAPARPKPAASVASLASLKIRRRPGNRAPDVGAGRFRLGRDKAESVATRLSPAPAAPGSSAEAGEPEIRLPAKIAAYWSDLRGVREFPSVSEPDFDRVAQGWPNSILFRARAGTWTLEADRIISDSASSGPSPTGRRGASRVDFSPIMLQWLLGLAEAVVREGRPMVEEETFPLLNRVVCYRAVALPLSQNQADVDHVLCHVTADG